MNIYLENAGVVRNCKYIKKVARLIGSKERIDLFLQSDRCITILEQMLIVMCVPSIKTMQLTIPVRKLLPELVWFANNFPRYSLQFVVDKPLKKAQWNRVCRLKDVIYVEDTTENDHNAFYDSVRRVIAQSSTCDTMKTATAYFTAVKMPIKRCEFSSCLGKTLFISRDGDVSFCKAQPKSTYMGKVGELTELFHTPQFVEVLKAMIAKRAKCSATCSHYQGCMGGCIFWPDCTAFRQDCDTAAYDITCLIEARHDLSKLPIHKERSIVYRLFGRKESAAPVK